MKVVLEGVVGSHAYGLATPESDVDRLGVFVLPTQAVLSLSGHIESVARAGSEDKDDGPDRAHHEIAKFMRLCIKANPTVMELLWLDDYEVMTDEGLALIGLRKKFLSTQVRSSYIGYANAQIRRLERRGDGSFSADTRNRTAKHARHVARLLTQVEEILLTGQLTVRLNPTQAQFCRSMGDLAVHYPAEFINIAEERISFLSDLPTLLPGAPDIEAIESVLLTIRKNNWT